MIIKYIILEKGYGSYTYENNQSVTKSSVYDLASLTKILSTMRFKSRKLFPLFVIVTITTLFVAPPT